MVEQQLRPRGIHDQRVLEAMREVPRHEFVPVQNRDESYEDRPLPIGYEQTISQPLTVAYMIQALQLSGGERVMDVGTGSGYAAAVISRIVREVHSVERIPQLAKTASERLAALGYDNIHVHVSDGTLGLPSDSPYDAIVVAAGGTQLPPPYVDQLADNGRIVIPLGDRNDGQRLMRFTKRAGKVWEEDLGAFAFVPLLGQFGWQPESNPCREPEDEA
jgi:protein-L-isoaspartate(D-aspartate) O-methyltransferase